MPVALFTDPASLGHDTGLLAEGQQVVAGLAAERLEVRDRGAVGGEHAQAVAGRERAQRLVGAEHRQGTAHALHVEDGFAHARLSDAGRS